MASKLELLLEAERRGIKMSDFNRELLDEARKRNLIPPVEETPPYRTDYGTETYGAPESIGYNPWVRSAAPMVLGTAGAIGGAVAGGGTPASLPLALGGSALGSAAGEGINQLFAPTSTPAADIATEGALGLVGEGVGRLIKPGLQLAGRAFGLAKPIEDIGRTMEAFRETGVTPKVTDVTRARFPATLEAGLTQMMTGQGIIRRRAEGQTAALREFLEKRFLPTLGPSEAKQALETGARVVAAGEKSNIASRAVEDRLYNRVERLGRDMAVDISPATQTAAQQILDKELLRQVDQRNTKLIGTLREMLDVGKPKTVKTGVLGPDGKEITRVVPQPTTIPFPKARVWAQTFAQNFERGELISGMPDAASKHLFGTLMTDIEGAVARTGNDALGVAFREARDFATRRRDVFVDSAVTKLMQKDPEQIVRVLADHGGPSAIRHAREAILGIPGAATPDPQAAETWNYFRRHIFEGIFERSTDENAKAFVGSVLSPAKLDRELKRIREALPELLTPTEMRSLENIQIVARAIRRGERVGAVPFTSSTGQAVTMQGAIASGGYFLGGRTGFLSVLLTPPVLAKMLTNPQAAEIIASRSFAKAAEGIRLGGLGQESRAAVARLGAIWLGEQDAEAPVSIGPEARGAAGATIGGWTSSRERR